MGSNPCVQTLLPSQRFFAISYRRKCTTLSHLFMKPVIQITQYCIRTCKHVNIALWFWKGAMFVFCYFSLLMLPPWTSRCSRLSHKFPIWIWSFEVRDMSKKWCSLFNPILVLSSHDSLFRDFQSHIIFPSGLAVLRCRLLKYSILEIEIQSCPTCRLKVQICKHFTRCAVCAN